MNLNITASASFEEWLALTDVYAYGLGALQRGEPGATEKLRRVRMALAVLEQGLAAIQSSSQCHGVASTSAVPQIAASQWAALGSSRNRGQCTTSPTSHQGLRVCDPAGTFA